MSPPGDDDPVCDWLGDAHPHDDAVDRAQRKAVLGLLKPAPKRVLDLGCGLGRLLVPLVEAGHHVVGVDQRAAALEACRNRLVGLGEEAALIEADFCAASFAPWGRFDAVLCVGNTFMTIVDMDAAIGVLRRARESMPEHGLVVLDDCPGDFWPEVTEGNWQSGLSEDGTTQLVWEAADAVFALRRGSAVDTSSWRPGPSDRRLRLWTDGALQLVARLAGLSAPQRLPGGHVLVMRCGGS